MRHFTAPLIFALCLVVVSVAKAAVGPPTEVTPEKMADQGFSIECRLRDHTIKEGTKPTRQTGVILVQVIFDAAKGPSIKEMNSASLVVREGDEVILSVPVEWASGDRPEFIQFSIHERMLPNASIVLTNHAKENGRSFAIPLQKFRPAS
jgi:hypothetical protein